MESKQIPLTSKRFIISRRTFLKMAGITAIRFRVGTITTPTMISNIPTLGPVAVLVQPIPPIATILGALPPGPGFRPCCLFAKDISSITSVAPPNVFDPTVPKNFEHKYGTGKAGYVFKSEIVGIVYTCAAGFVDIGHLRDLADLTKYYYHYLAVIHADSKSKKVMAGKKMDTFQGKGTVIVKVDIPEAQYINVARSLAYDESIFHEIETYWIDHPSTGAKLAGGTHNSSFSPEDAVSNYLGTYIGGRAISVGGDFNKAVTSELQTLLNTTLKAQNASITNDAFDKAAAKGWFSGPLLKPKYILRRNFDVRPINPDPWLISGLPGCPPGSAFPSSIPREIPASAGSYYETEFNFDSVATWGTGKTKVKNTEFATQIGNIRTNAKSVYGPTYDKP